MPTPTIVKDLENPGRRAFQQDVQFINAPRGTVNSFAVPPGKNLVIEFVTVNLSLNSLQVVPVIFIATSVGGSSVSHMLVLNKLDPPDWGVSQVVRLYASSKTSIGVQVSSINEGIFNGHITLAGHLVDAT
jgi:hypothetical protein